MTKKLSMLAVLVTFLNLNCATMFASGHESVFVTSDPPDATVRVNGNTVASTPADVSVPRRQGDNYVEISKPGYRSQTCRLTSSAGAGYIVSDTLWCLMLFPLGCLWFIDAGGAWNGLDDNECHAKLEKAEH